MHAPRHPLEFAQDTVFQDWFSPMSQALGRVRFSDAARTALPMQAFIQSACLRQLLDARSLREYLQTLFHQDATLTTTPIARATWADALACPSRLRVLRQALHALVQEARERLPDRLAHLPGLGTRPVIATDASYLNESAHFTAVYPEQGGVDNQKGHMMLSHYDVRRGIPLHASTRTQSLGEMRVLKAVAAEPDSYLSAPRAIHVVDRAYIDSLFWDQLALKHASTMITRMKSVFKYEVRQERSVQACSDNDGVRFDRTIALRNSKQVWRLIGFTAPDGQAYEYLTNDQDLLPGVVAFLYHRRWDKEKYYDCFKNDLAGRQAWGKSTVAIEQQALLGIVTVILTQLFMQRRQHDLGLEVADSTQCIKHQKKMEQHQACPQGVTLRATWTQLSKIPRQLWRFLKNCFSYAHELTLYKRQLEPLMRQYL